MKRKSVSVAEESDMVEQSTSFGGVNPTVGLPREFQLLLLCVRGDNDGERREQIRSLLREELDWVSVIVAAMRHGVLPLLYRALSRTGPDLVPAGTLADLREQYEANG